LKGSASICNNNDASYTMMAEESINDHELAKRKQLHLEDLELFMWTISMGFQQFQAER